MASRSTTAKKRGDVDAPESQSVESVLKTALREAAHASWNAAHKSPNHRAIARLLSVLEIALDENLPIARKPGPKSFLAGH